MSIYEEYSSSNNCTNNGIDKYIELDCRESNNQYIFDSIKKTDLSIILKEIDINKADNYAQCNKLKTACELFNNGYINYSRIAEKIDVCVNTARRYIRKGKELGIIK